jgi:hypothetical protein
MLCPQSIVMEDLSLALACNIVSSFFIPELVIVEGLMSTLNRSFAQWGFYGVLVDNLMYFDSPDNFYLAHNL